MSTWHRATPTRSGQPKKSVPRAPAKKSVPPTPPPAPVGPSSRPRWIWLLPAGVVVAFLLLLFHPGSGGTPAQVLSYTSFVSDVTANKVSTAAITSAGAVSGMLLGGKAYTSQIPVALNDGALPALLLGHKVQVTGTSASTGSVLGLVLEWVLPVLLFVGLFVWLGRRSSKQLSGRMGGIMAIGKSKAKVYDEDRPKTRFADIAGYEGSKAEVMEVVDYLKHPARYDRAGAVGPKGVLMVGPPGTGKTLLARACLSSL
jgi:cell division protease FtsH